jgi:hypothetical protein
MATTTRPSFTTALDRPAFKVADLSLAEFGRKEIRLAEQEMPGLMALRAEFRATKYCNELLTWHCRVIADAGGTRTHNTRRRHRAEFASRRS